MCIHMHVDGINMDTHVQSDGYTAERNVRDYFIMKTSFILL